MGSLRCFTIQQGNLLITKQHKSKRMNKLQVIFVLALAASAANADEFTCFSHVESKCSEPGEVWTAGGCSSVHGGFLGNSNNLHRIIVDDFTDSMSYLLMASSFSTDVTNKLGFSKYFMEKSDSMWARGKDMMKYVLKRGGKMGNGFQIPPVGVATQLNDLDYSTEMKSLGLSLDLLKSRAEDALIANMFALRVSKPSDNGLSSYDPATAHMLEELSESYADEIRETTEKLNNIGRMVKKDNSRNLALHLFDKVLEG